jgi:endogenous inhibitor of DNA gyrase (YacG/DUF329 family)
MERRCPVCGKVVDPPFHKRTKEDIFPFCSRRCKLVDLGAWLNSEYRMISELNPPNTSLLSDDYPEDIEEKQQV